MDRDAPHSREWHTETLRQAGPRAFGDTVVPGWQLDRAETARVSSELDRLIVRARQSGALVGSVGLGRTHLIRVLAERTDATRWRPVYLPQAAFDFDDLCRYCVGLASGMRSTGVPEVDLRALLQAVWREGCSLLVFLDDADSMPRSTVDAWLDLTIQQVPSLVTVFVTRDDHTPPCIAALDDDAPIVRFTARMTEPETCDYLLDRLSRVRAAPEVLARFDEGVVERLYTLSQGVPVRLHALAQAYLDMPTISAAEAPDWLSRLAVVTTDVEETDAVEAPEGPIAKIA